MSVRRGGSNVVGRLSSVTNRAAVVLLVATLPWIGSCGVDLGYLIPQAWGQLDIVFRSVPIDDAIASGKLEDWQVEKLRLIQDAREFATEAIGLNTADSYEEFFDTGGKTLAWNVSACAKHAFAPKRWSFPIVGTVPYLGYFDWQQATTKVFELREQGYDVLSYPVNAYSTLDFLPNPVFSGMLEYNDLALVDTVLHELLHDTVWSHASTTFNESLATFVGRQGAIDYFADRRPENPAYVNSAIDWYADVDRYNEFIFALFEELHAYYSQSGVDRKQLVDGREAVFQGGRERFAEEVQPQMRYPRSFDWVLEMPTNNAWILANTRYNEGLDTFAQVYEMTGRDWTASLLVFAEAAAMDDPYAYLERWVANGGTAAETRATATLIEGPVAKEVGAVPADEGAVFILDPGPFPRTVGPGGPFKD